MKSPDGNIFFSSKTGKPVEKDKYTSFKTFTDWDEKSIPAHRQSSQTEIRNSSLDYFYGEEETSLRVWKLDDRLNSVYKWFLRTVFCALSLAAFLHIKQRMEMRHYAREVCKTIKKEGGKVHINED